MGALTWTKDAEGGCYRSGLFTIAKEGRWWTVERDGVSICQAYRTLWLAQNAVEGWLMTHPEAHGLRVVRGGREDSA